MYQTSMYLLGSYMSLTFLLKGVTEYKLIMTRLSPSVTLNAVVSGQNNLWWPSTKQISSVVFQSCCGLCSQLIVASCGCEKSILLNNTERILLEMIPVTYLTITVARSAPVKVKELEYHKNPNVIRLSWTVNLK